MGNPWVGLAWLTNIVGHGPSFAEYRPMSSDLARLVRCPCRAPGDRLWVSRQDAPGSRFDAETARSRARRIRPPSHKEEFLPPLRRRRRGCKLACARVCREVAGHLRSASRFARSVHSGACARACSRRADVTLALGCCALYAQPARPRRIKTGSRLGSLLGFFRRTGEKDHDKARKHRRSCNAHFSSPFGRRSST
jgi:hypothetical protein